MVKKIGNGEKKEEKDNQLEQEEREQELDLNIPMGSYRPTEKD